MRATVARYRRRNNRGSRTNATTATPKKLFAELSDPSWQRRYAAHVEILRRGLEMTKSLMHHPTITDLCRHSRIGEKYPLYGLHRPRKILLL